MQFFRQVRQQGETPPATPERKPIPTPARTPFTQRRPQGEKVNGAQLVLNKSTRLEGQIPVFIRSHDSPLTEGPYETHRASFLELFQDESLMYIEDQKAPSYSAFGDMIRKEFEDDAGAIISFLDHLPELAERCFPELNSLNPTGPIHVSIAREDKGPNIRVVVSNLIYQGKDKTDQVLISIEKHDYWSMTVYCATWTKDPKNTYPEHDPKKLLPNLPVGVNLALPEGYVCTSSHILQGTKQIRTSDTATSHPFFAVKEFQTACGKNSSWKTLNTLEALLELLKGSLSLQANLQIVDGQPRTILKTKKNHLVFMRFYVAVNGKLLEIGAFVQLSVSIWRNYFCQLQGGFARELMQIDPNEHPLVTFTNSETPTDNHEASYVEVAVIRL
ncbi:MAG: hypothetical protein LVR00_01960 [Rhabdochlamydiaceae bacterium]|jgi:hypothetical protein